jgi:hypothetical protein
VARPYDVLRYRYNSCVHGTLWTLDAALEGARLGLFSWAWVAHILKSLFEKKKSLF